MHRPLRPQWTCLADDRPWPCDSAKERLRAEYLGTPASLRIYLQDQAGIAAYDRRDDPAAEVQALVNRIIGWIEAP